MSNTNRSIVIPAASGGISGIYSELVDGSFFACVSATAAFLVAPDDGRKLSMSAGRGFGSREGSPWRRLVFYNTSASTITVEFYSGTEPYLADPSVTANVSGSVSNALASCIAASPSQFLKTSTAAAAPVALVATSTYFRKAIVLAKNTLAGADNTGDVQIGPSATASQQPIIIPPGGEYTLEPPGGAKWDFIEWYLKVATNGDGVVVIYT